MLKSLTESIPPFMHWKDKLFLRIHPEALVILLYTLTTVLMTYPIAFRLGGEWLAMRDIDTYAKLWDNWWLERSFTSGQSLYYTNDLFHPDGLDLTYHSISWTIAILSWLLAMVMDTISAYNVTILLSVFTTAYAAYLLIRSLVEGRVAAWLGGAVYSFAPYHIAHTGGHPDLVHLAPLPLAVLLLNRALTKSNTRAAIGAALMVGFAAFTSLYIMNFTLLTLGPIILSLMFERRRWQDQSFWRTIIIFAIFSAIVLSFRLTPILRNPEALSYAIESKSKAALAQTDLLAFFVPSRLNPLFKPYVSEIAYRFVMNEKWPAYLGIVPLGLALYSLTWKKHRSSILPWFGIGIFFILLSLGPVLRFNGQIYESVRLPASYLMWFPPIRAVARPDFFVLALLLPLAVCAAYGFNRLFESLRHRRKVRIVLIVAIPSLLLFEYWNGEYWLVPVAVNPFYEQLANEKGSFAIIELPMGRQASKHFMYYQTVHEKPIIEGMSARTPAEAYDYIETNPLLYRWREELEIDCVTFSNAEIQLGIDQIIIDNFRYIIVHHQLGQLPEFLAGYFAADPIYRDNVLSVYSVADIRSKLPCSL